LYDYISFSPAQSQKMNIHLKLPHDIHRCNPFSSMVLAELHARASIRLREIPLVPGRPLYYNSFTYGVGAGFRLPAPFLWGVEFYGSLAKPAAEAQAAWSGPVLFRIFVEYTL